jgi:hypothetical protein
MRATHIVLSIILGTGMFTGRAVASLITDALGGLSQSDYEAYVGTLQGFGTRYYNTLGNSAATGFLTTTLDAFGLTVRQDSFQYGGTHYNVEASLPGLVTPERIFIVGAHFDTISGSAATDAPGADDNASGTAAMLEIASVLSQYRFASTIRFVGFNAEEQGLIGSYAYAAATAARNENIVGMLNLDMIAYTAGNFPVDLEVIGDPWLVNAFITSATTYTPGLLTQATYGNFYESDHYFFHSSEYAGSSSLFASEDTAEEVWGGSNPYYHMTTDTASRLDFNFAFQVTQATTAALADLAGIMAVPEPSTMPLLLVSLVLATRGRRRQGHPGLGSR